MLKKISVSQARLGMYLHAFDGAWMDHPFWKTSFVIREQSDLDKLKAAKLDGVWIDTAKGLDVIEARRPEVVPATHEDRPAHGVSVQLAAAQGAAEQEAAPQPARSLQDELQQAQAVCQRGREQVTSMFAEARLGKAVDAEQCLVLVDEISNSVFRNPGALVSLARLKTKDAYTYMHSVAVCALMVALARELGQDKAQCRQAGMAGLLHDLGKAVMPLEVLNKPGKLTDDEFAIMRAHPARGHEMLVEGRGAGPAVLDVCLHHHEKFDGSGYPHHLVGDQISLLARMGAVCDVYDAITSDRPYRAGWDPAESLSRMASWQGHFDPKLFQSFVKSLGIYPVGSLVRMDSGRLAIVMEQNPGALTRPIVKVFFSTRSRAPITPMVLDTSRSTDHIVARDNAANWGLKNLEELWAGEASRPQRSANSAG